MQVHGGYTFAISGEDYKLHTNLLYSSDFVTWRSHLSAIFDIKNQFWIGAGYQFSTSAFVFQDQSTSQLKHLHQPSQEAADLGQGLDEGLRGGAGVGQDAGHGGGGGDYEIGRASCRERV